MLESFQFMFKFKVITIYCLLVSGCSSVYAPIPHQVALQSDTALASTAVINHTFIRSKNDNILVCSQNSADAAFDQGSNESLNASLPTGSSEGIGNQSSADDVEMSGRTPSLLMARELMYRSCEFAANYNLNKEDAQALYEKTLNLIGTVWATEAGNTTISISDALKSSADTTFKTEDSSGSTDNTSSDEEDDDS